MPANVYSDDGSEFKREFKELMDFWDIEKQVTRGHAYFAERTIKEAMLRRIAAGAGRRGQWHLMLADILSQINGRKHATTQVAPNLAYSDPEMAEIALRNIERRAKHKVTRPEIKVGDMVRIRVKPIESRGSYRVNEIAWSEKVYRVVSAESGEMGALAAFLQHLPVLEMPDVGHRLLRHALDLALLLARAVGLDREDAVHLGAQAHVLQDPGGEGLVAELAQLAHHLDGLGARRCRERAQVPLGVLGLAGHVEEGGAVQVRLGHGVERVLQLEDLHHHGVGVREEQPHLREEPPHVEVVGLLHHELGELQRAGADLGGHAHAGLAAVRLERLHEGQEPTFSATTLPAVLSCLRSLCLSSMKPAMKGLQAKR